MNKQIIYIGNVVKWGDSYWVVADVSNSIDPEKCKLISLCCSNVEAYPSRTYPSKTKGIKSVQVVADTIAEYIEKNMLAKFPHYE